jgi:hypothetical protein
VADSSVGDCCIFVVDVDVVMVNYSDKKIEPDK